MTREQLNVITRERLPELPAIVIVIEFVKFGARGPLYVSRTVDGRELSRSRSPFYDAARALRAEGVEYWREIAMRRTTREQIDMRAMLGWAANRTIVELAAGGIHRRRWTPYPTQQEEPEPEAGT